MRSVHRGLFWSSLLMASIFAITGCSFFGASTPSPHGSAGNRTGAPGSTRMKVMAFYDQGGSPVGPDPLSLLASHPGLVTEVAPFWYEVEPSGNILSKPQGNIESLAKSQHLKLTPLVTNAGSTDAFLYTAATRSMAISHIVHLVTSRHYAGVNIDFQGLKSSDRSRLTAFMTTLSHKMPKGTLVSMSVVPLTNQNGQSSAYDYAALDRVTNAIVLMAYDLHGDGTLPGPVSPLPWVRRSIQTALHAGIAPQKLYLGIADYGYDWTAGSTKATTVPVKVMDQARYGHYIWNPVDAEGTITYATNGVRHTIWFVPAKGAAARVRLAASYHLGGVAFWRIGYEDASWWKTVATALKNPTGAKTAASRRRTATPSHPSRSPQHRGHAGH